MSRCDGSATFESWRWSLKKTPGKGRHRGWNPRLRIFPLGNFTLALMRAKKDRASLSSRVALYCSPKFLGGEFHLRLNITGRSIAHKYREGKMKKTLKRELNIIWSWQKRSVWGQCLASFQVSVQEWGEKFIFHFTLEPGACDGGLVLAVASSLQNERVYPFKV